MAKRVVYLAAAVLVTLVPTLEAQGLAAVILAHLEQVNHSLDHSGLFLRSTDVVASAA
jgi:hypothetical protein